jgi:hypothetical protein
MYVVVLYSYYCRILISSLVYFQKINRDEKYYKKINSK